MLFRSFGLKNIGKKNKQKNYRFSAQKINTKINDKGVIRHNDLLDFELLKFSKTTLSQSKSKKDKNKLSIINNVEHIKTENNYISVNINANSFGTNGFYLKKNRTLNNSNNNIRSKNSNKYISNSQYETSKDISYLGETKKNNNINCNSNTNRKNKFMNQKKLKFLNLTYL